MNDASLKIIKGTNPPVLGVIGSGNGSNYAALAEAIIAGHLPAQVACVISDVRDAYILKRAQHFATPAYYVDPAPFRSKLAGAAEQRVIQLLQEHQVALVVLAGFMRIVKHELLNAFPGRIINIHPSLLPAFPGLRAWQQALDAGAHETGCTVHFVDAGIDTGKIILQRKVPIMPDDTPETLHARIQRAEHQAYPDAINRLLRSGR